MEKRKYHISSHFLESVPNTKQENNPQHEITDFEEKGTLEGKRDWQETVRGVESDQSIRDIWIIMNETQ